MRKALLLLCCLVAVTGIQARTGTAAGTASCPPVSIEFFFTPGCSECSQVKEEVLPELTTRYEGFYLLSELDIGIKENYLKLVGYQERLGEMNAHVSMVLDGRHALNGFEEIRDGLFPLLDRLVQERMSGTAPSGPPPEAAPAAPEQELSERVRRFTLIGVISAGLVDGINPCAISTLVFFVSLLSVFKVTRRQIFTIGSAFVCASFLTYLAIGFGLLRALHLFAAFSQVRTAINWIMIAVLAVFAGLSFRDAWRYSRSRNPKDVSLQLPDKLKQRIHKIMRGGLGMGSLLVGSLVIGSSVTVLESVCTGQVYIPTLVMVIKSGQADLASFTYLILYNLMFQVPIVTVFILILQGMKTSSLMEWSKKNVVFSKIALGIFFVAMAGLILLL